MWSTKHSLRGKTFFANQVTETLAHPRPRTEKTPGPVELNQGKVEFVQLNLAEVEEPEARSILSTTEKSDKPYLFFVDEVDSKSGSSWPYETLLPYLDSSKTIPRVFLLAGSSGDSMAEMKSLIASRPKGADLISRIPESNQFEIPSMTLGDKILVTLASLRRASRDTGRDVAEVEKLALYYVSKNRAWTAHVSCVILVTLASLRRASRDTGRDVAEVEKLALYYVSKNRAWTAHVSCESSL